MKKQILILIACLFSIQSMHAQPYGQFSQAINDQCVLQYFRCDPVCNDFMSQSFMYTRPVYRNIAAQYANFWQDAVYEKPGCFFGSSQGLFIYQQSFNHKSAARYFLLNHKSTIAIKGDAAPDAVHRDVRAEWLELSGDFDGFLTLDPFQKQWALWLEYNQDLKRFFCHPFFEPWWIAIAFPIQFIENNLKPSGTPAALAALNRTNLEFGRIDGRRKKVGLGEINIKLGSTFMARDGFQIGTYMGILIPTGRGQSARFMFDPFVGNNGYLGVSQGVQFEFPLVCATDCQNLTLFFNIENIYFVRNFQQRTFDLFNKPWTRFILLNQNDGTTNIPATQVLTRNVKVRPFNMVDLSVGFRYQTNYLEAEIGYDLWAHGDERIILDCDFPEGQFGIAGTLPNTTASESTIATLAPNDAEFVGIRSVDINMMSGAMRAVHTNRVHGALGTRWCSDAVVLFGGIGAYAEFPNKNSALNNWGIWAKIGATF